MNNQKGDGAHGYQHVEHHDSEDMISRASLVTGDGSVSKDVKTDDVATKDVKKEIMTANESSGLSDDDIDIKVESPSDWDPLQIREIDKMFLHQNERCMEMKKNLQIKSQNLIEAKQLQFPQPALNQISTKMSIQRPVALGTPVQVNIAESGSIALPLSTNKSVRSSLFSVEHHDSKDMIARVALVTDDGSVSGGVSKDVITDDVAIKDVKTEIMTDNESSGLSDDEIDIKVESISDWDPLQVREDDKVYIHPNEWCTEMQQNWQIKSQNVIEAKQLLFPQPALNQISTEMSIHQHPVPLGTPIQVNFDDSGLNVLPLSKNKSVPSSLSKDTFGGSVCQSNISSSNKRDAATAFDEQPSNLPCSCFVCGHHLSNSNERFIYLKSQKLINSQISLLELLSDVLNQIVVTNTGTVDLCSRCLGLINETDSVYTRLNLLKKQICKLFVENQSTKLTYQASPYTCNLRSTAMNPVPLVYCPPNLNLNDLASLKPNSAKKPQKNQLLMKKTSELSSSNPPVKVKTNRGRPRKPFGCQICKRRFSSKKMVFDHMTQEHKHSKEFEMLKSQADPGLGVEEDGKSGNINKENLKIQQEQKDYTGKSTVLDMSDPLEIEPVSNIQSTNTTESVKDSRTGHSSISSPNSVKDSRTDHSSTSSPNSVKDSRTRHSSTSSSNSVKDSRTGHSSTSSSNSVKDSRTGHSSNSVKDSRTGHSSNSVKDSRTGHSSNSVKDSRTGHSSTSSSNSVKDSRTGHSSTSSSNSVKDSRTGHSSTSSSNSVKDSRTGHSSTSSSNSVKDSRTGHSSTSSSNSVKDSRTGHSSTSSSNSVKDSRTGHSSTSSSKSVKDSRTGHSSTSSLNSVKDSRTGHSSTSSSKSVKDSRTGHSSTSSLNSVKDSRTGHSSTSSPNSVKQQKTGMDYVKQLLASMRPIQPKPQTVIRTAQDGSMVLLMNPPTVVDSSSKGIIASPGYTNQVRMPLIQRKKPVVKRDMKHRKGSHGLRKQKRDKVTEDGECGNKYDGQENSQNCLMNKNFVASEKVLAYKEY